jgi:hypothetical protein
MPPLLADDIHRRLLRLDQYPGLCKKAVERNLRVARAEMAARVLEVEPATSWSTLEVIGISGAVAAFFGAVGAGVGLWIGGR